MRTCPNCQCRVEDNAAFCPECGLRFSNADANPGQNYNPNQTTGGQQPPYPPQYIPYDPYDHTSEFDPKDISDNKVIAMLIYLTGFVGILIALLSQSVSKYVAFHLRQALKFMVVQTLVGFVSLLLCWTLVVPAVAAIFLAVLWVIKIICFFWICSGKAKEPYIIRSLGFLK